MTYDLNTLRLVNTKVNLLDYKTQIGDDWDPFTANGFDCNNYATRKMEELAARGVPVEAAAGGAGVRLAAGRLAGRSCRAARTWAMTSTWAASARTRAAFRFRGGVTVPLTRIVEFAEVLRLASSRM